MENLNKKILSDIQKDLKNTIDYLKKSNRIYENNDKHILLIDIYDRLLNLNKL